jgi:hypothetical protein
VRWHPLLAAQRTNRFASHCGFDDFLFLDVVRITIMTTLIIFKFWAREQICITIKREVTSAA